MSSTKPDESLPPIIDIDEEVEDLLNRSKEDDSGHIEYKFKLTNLRDEQRARLTSQLKARLNSEKEYGQAVYDIGLTDDGFALGLTKPELNESLSELHQIVKNADAKICDVRKEEVVFWAKSEQDLLNRYLAGDIRMQPEGTSHKKRQEHQKESAAASKAAKKGLVKLVRYVAEVLIRRHSFEGEYVDIRIGVAGNVDCGKSSLIGVLTKGVLDNGDGSARASITRLQHEQDTGRTSAVGQQIMGFNDKGQSVNDIINLHKPTWEDIVKQSTKIVTFFDLAGHEKYLKTTILGMSSNRPDYALIMIGANMGLTGMTAEHINLCMTLSIPFIIVLTKIDLAPAHVLKNTLTDITQLLSKKTHKLPYKIRDENDVLKCARQLKQTLIAPIFHVSNVSGEGLDLLKLFLNYLPIRKSYTKTHGKPTKLQVQEVYKVPGAGTVVGGMLLSGTVRVNDVLKLGPSRTGEFMNAKVRSIQCKRVDCDQVKAGRFVCFNLANIDRNLIKKGMFLLSPSMNPKACWEFIAKVGINKSSSARDSHVKSNSINITAGYQPHCHIGHIPHTCKIQEIMEVEISKKKTKELIANGIDPATYVPESIGAGDRATIKMRFCFGPQLIFEEDRTKFVFREARTRGIGMITQVLDTKLEPMSNRDVTKCHKKRPSRKERRLARETK